MLNRIEIINFATIENMSFDLGDGLNIITGETGTGKSVLVQAISTALGDRADISMIRTGADKALIQIAGEFNGEELIISRELLSSGKSIAKLNGEMISLNDLRKYCSKIIDIHGQYDNQQILDPSNHIAIIDAFTDTEGNLSVLLAKAKELYDEYSQEQRTLQELVKAESEAVRQQEYYKFESEHIKSLSLKPDEYEQLSADAEMMKNGEKIFRAVSSSYSLMHESEPSVLSLVSQCLNLLNDVSDYSGKLKNTADELNDIYYRLEDISNSLRTTSLSLSFSEEEMNAVQDRLSILEEAKRRYRMDIPSIINYGNELKDKLDTIDDFDKKKNQLESRIAKLLTQLSETAEEISIIRKSGSVNLENAISRELSALSFPNAEFKVRFERLEHISKTGFDKAEFMISTNPGEPIRPLAKIASGGEISRIMLAFKYILGDTDNIETMIFDEIDTGISGHTALIVGQKLLKISHHHQIICITHLPQIAAYGSSNYLISKDLTDGTPKTKIAKLDEEGKLKMLANLISGNSSSDAAIDAAKSLVSSAVNSQTR